MEEINRIKNSLKTKKIAILIGILITLSNISVLSFYIKEDKKIYEQEQIIFNSSINNNNSFTLELHSFNVSYIRIIASKTYPDLIIMSISAPALNLEISIKVDEIIRESDWGKTYEYDSEYTFRNMENKTVKYNLTIQTKDSENQYKLIIIHNYNIQYHNVSVIRGVLSSTILIILMFTFLILNPKIAINQIKVKFHYKVIIYTIFINSLIWVIYSAYSQRLFIFINF